jgi:hypothetical protein
MRRALVLLATMTLVVVASGSLALAASSLNNGNFETGNLSGWSVATPNGGGAIATSSYSYWRWGEDWQLHLYWMYPKEGSYFALLTSGNQQSDVTNKISQPFEASNGDKVSGWVFLNTDSMYVPSGDKGQVVIKSASGTTVATPFEEYIQVGGNPDWKYWEYTFSGLTGAGQFQIEAQLQNTGKIEEGYAEDHSDMGLDDVKTSTGSPAPPSDTTPPETFIGSGPSGTITVANATFRFSSSEANSTFQCRLNGAAYSACTSPKDYTNLSNGAHTFDVRAKDGAGNVDATPASRTFTVDTIPPETFITSGPAEGSSTTSKSATFSFSSEANSIFECKLDSAAFSACSSPKNYTRLAKGSHTFRVRATDAAGNTDASPDSRTWTVGP